MPDPKDKPRTLLVGWISRLELAVELGLSIDTLRLGRPSAPAPPASAPGGRSITVALPSRNGWKSKSRQPRAVVVPEGAGDASANPQSRWTADRVAEARAVIADVAHHSDHLIRLACNVLATLGDTAAERKDARVLLVVIDARQPIRHAQRQDQHEGVAR